MVRAEGEAPPGSIRGSSEPAETDHRAERVGPRVRVLIVDDHRMFAEALRLLLAGETDIEVLAPAGSGDAALAACRARASASAARRPPGRFPMSDIRTSCSQLQQKRHDAAPSAVNN